MSQAAAPEIDVEVSNHGSVIMVRPVTQAAKDWVEANVSLEGWQWFGGAFAVEPRYADALIEGMQGDGLMVH